MIDKSRIFEYNDQIADIKEIQVYDKSPDLKKWTKTNWYASHKYPMGIKARDFCSTGHFNFYSNGSATLVYRYRMYLT